MFSINKNTFEVIYATDNHKAPEKNKNNNNLKNKKINLKRKEKKGQRVDLRADALLSYQCARVSEINLFFYGLNKKRIYFLRR